MELGMRERIQISRIPSFLKVCLQLHFHRTFPDHPTQKAIGAEVVEWHEKSRRKKRIGSATDQAQVLTKKRPRLFGGNLEEYVEATGETIPVGFREFF